MIHRFRTYAILSVVAVVMAWYYSSKNLRRCVRGHEEACFETMFDICEMSGSLLCEEWVVVVHSFYLR